MSGLRSKKCGQQRTLRPMQEEASTGTFSSGELRREGLQTLPKSVGERGVSQIPGFTVRMTIIANYSRTSSIARMVNVPVPVFVGDSGSS